MKASSPLSIRFVDATVSIRGPAREATACRPEDPGPQPAELNANRELRSVTTRIGFGNVSWSRDSTLCTKSHLSVHEDHPLVPVDVLTADLAARDEP